MSAEVNKEEKGDPCSTASATSSNLVQDFTSFECNELESCSRFYELRML
jgi:hypothetical protein